MDFTHEYEEELVVEDETRVQTWVVSVHVSDFGHAGRLSGPPEDCYEAEGPSFEITRIRCRQTKQEIDTAELLQRLAEARGQTPEEVEDDVMAELAEEAGEVGARDEDSDYDAWRDRQDDPEDDSWENYDR